jgi:hypothetical protein
MKLICGEKCKPAIVDGQVIQDYWVDEDGNIWSTKRKQPKQLSPDNGSSNSKYPGVVLMIDGIRKSIDVHRVICSTFHKFPVPNGITKKEWNLTPQSVRDLLNTLFQVNHIDHNTKNHHPSNLEWVTVKQNSSKYQKHRINGLSKTRK